MKGALGQKLSVAERSKRLSGGIVFGRGRCVCAPPAARRPCQHLDCGCAVRCYFSKGGGAASDADTHLSGRGRDGGCTGAGVAGAQAAGGAHHSGPGRTRATIHSGGAHVLGARGSAVRRAKHGAQEMRKRESTPGRQLKRRCSALIAASPSRAGELAWAHRGRTLVRQPRLRRRPTSQTWQLPTTTQRTTLRP